MPNATALAFAGPQIPAAPASCSADRSRRGGPPYALQNAGDVFLYRTAAGPTVNPGLPDGLLGRALLEQQVQEARHADADQECDADGGVSRATSRSRRLHRRRSRARSWI
ncbi:hypothetical protein GCM10010350_76910 [Streptomyces galilaeus]|nr:hypothetical protein GCM10010350_76910 [Streptomyces galilaeus]